jgi:D-alanyl-D-alanine carboxypeptidase/D-alanyl-D-alanine-endopeptidase (penicillin-binding protein 4)
VAVKFARTLGAKPVLVDGSGLSHTDKASPRSVATLLDRLRDRPDFKALYDSLPIAGRDGTLDTRMRRGAARGHCHAKTGSLIGVSALSGYCTTRSGRTVVFSILMNAVNVYGARTIQDRMVQAIARG